MKLKKLIIFGSGPHARICLNEFLKIYSIDKLFFFDSISKEKEVKILNKKIILIKSFLNLKKITNSDTYFFIGIGDNILRKKVYNEFKKYIKKPNWVNLVSKNTLIDRSVKIGKGTAIMPGTVINFKSVIKDQCIINTSCSIDHDCTIDSFVNLSPGVNIAGNVKIGKLSKIGIGASVSDNLKINNNVTIGANSFVNKNCKPNKIYYGTPIKLYNKIKKQ